MQIGSLIPGLPAGVNWAIVGLAVVIVLLHGVDTIKGLVSMVRNFGKPKPRQTSVNDILAT